MYAGTEPGHTLCAACYLLFEAEVEEELSGLCARHFYIPRMNAYDFQDFGECLKQLDQSV